MTRSSAARRIVMVLVALATATGLALFGVLPASAAGTVTFSGHVYVGDTSHSAAAGQVKVSWAGHFDVQWAGLPSVLTDASGNYTITGLDVGSSYALRFDTLSGPTGSVLYSNFAVEPRVQNYQLVYADSDKTGLDVTMPYPADITGHVTLGSAGAPVPAGQVQVTYQIENGQTVYTPTSAPVLTDASGNYRLPSLPAAFYLLNFKYVGTGPYLSSFYKSAIDFDSRQDIQLLGASTTADMVMPDKLHISGQIYLGGPDSGQAPSSVLAGAGDVQVTYGYSASSATGPFTPATSSPVLTAADGSYSLTGLVPGYYQLATSYVGSSGNYVEPSYFPSADLQLSYGSVDQRDLTMEKLITVTGHVNLGTSEQSAGAGDVKVSLFSTVNSAVLNSTTTDAQGNYTLTGVPQGQLWLGFSYEGSAQVSYTTVSNTTALNGQREDQVVNATLLSASISGHIHASSDGFALPGIEVLAVEYDASTQAFVKVVTTTTDSTGYYSFPELANDSYLVQAYDPNRVYATENYQDESPYYQADYIDVTAGQLYTADIDMQLANHIAGRISGVSDADLAAGKVSVQVEVQDYSSGSPVWFETGDIWPVAADGTYNVGDLPDDAYRLQYVANGAAGPVTALSPEYILAGGETVTYSPTLPVVVPGDVSYVKALYQDFLSRDPSGSEIGFWTDALSIGLPRTSIAAGFVTSDEYRLIRIDAAYQSVLGRASDAQGRQWWLAAVKAGSLQIDDVAEHFYSSQEYVDAHQGNGESNVTRNWIHQLYTDLLHRNPDASGLNFWEAATVANGRQSVVDGLWDSQETAGARVSAMYASYLGRTPDPDGLVFWTHVDLTLGDSVTRSSITASDEYYNLAGTRYPASSPGAARAV